MKMHMIVLVDDEPEVLKALRRSLAREPYLVLTTCRPREALRWVEVLDVSAVVSDERMPEMTGTELLDRVSDRSPETARIMLTAYGGDAAQHRHEIEVMIAKPWDDTMLKRTLREILPEPVGD
jgi:DNA-binding NtrC family response regulator